MSQADGRSGLSCANCLALCSPPHLVSLSQQLYHWETFRHLPVLRLTSSPPKHTCPSHHPPMLSNALGGCTTERHSNTSCSLPHLFSPETFRTTLQHSPTLSNTLGGCTTRRHSDTSCSSPYLFSPKPTCPSHHSPMLVTGRYYETCGHFTPTSPCHLVMGVFTLFYGYILPIVLTRPK